MTLDAVGPWPPIQETHVEMDGAWALYEAWVKLQLGDVDTALVYGYGKSSPGPIREVLSRQLDPYYVAPLWPDAVSLAALQARALLDAGKVDRGANGRGRGPQPARAARQPLRPAVGPARSTSSSTRSRLVDPLRKHDCPPITDGAAAVVLAAGDLARELCERRPGSAASTTASSRWRSACATSPTSAVDPARRREGRRRRRRLDVAELHAPFTHQELILREALGLDDDVDVNPSGGALAANPIMAAGLIRIGEAAHRIIDGDGQPGVAHATIGPVPAAEPRLRAGRGATDGQATASPSSASARRSTRPTRGDVSMAGLVREAARRALDDAEMTWADIDAVVIGKAPDFFEGVMMPELYLADALGAVGKPMFRVHTAGSVGGSTAHRRRQLVQAGIHERVLTVAFEKQSESDAMWALSMPIPFQPPLHAGAGGYFAPHIRATCAGRRRPTTSASSSRSRTG